MIDILNYEFLGFEEYISETVTVLDKHRDYQIIKAKIENNITCNIELQVVDRKNIERRIIFYWSKMYNMSIKAGQDYEKLEKGIVILILDYELEGLKEIQKYITKWNIREEEYSNLAELREKYIMDQKAIEDAGFDKGVKAGIKQEKATTVKRMKKQKIDIETISVITGLTVEEIENLE